MTTHSTKSPSSMRSPVQNQNSHRAEMKLLISLTAARFPALFQYCTHEQIQWVIPSPLYFLAYFQKAEISCSTPDLLS